MSARDTGECPEAVAGKRSSPVVVRGLVSVAGWGLFCLLLFFVGRALIGQLKTGDLTRVDIRFGWLIAAMLAQALIISLGGWLFHILLARFGHRCSWRALLIVAWIARVGKYLPGKLASVAGAIWMLRDEDVPVSVASGMLLLHQGLTVAVGFLISVPLTMWGPVRELLPVPWLWCLVLLATSIVLLHPRVFFPLVNALLRRLRVPDLGPGMRLRDYLPAFLLMVAGRIISGLSLWCVARSVSDVSIGWLPVLTCGAALAGTVGLLSFFAPGGLGVRDGILLILIGQVMGREGPTVAVIVILARVVQIIAEAFLAATGFLMRRRILRRGRHLG